MKFALVTGAGSGIGRAVSLALHDAGYSMVLAGRRAEKLAETAAAANPGGGEMLAVPADISQPDSVRALFAKTREASNGAPWWARTSRGLSYARRKPSRS